MTKFTIDEKICLKHKLTPAEVLAALAVRQAKNYEEMMENLFNREVLVQQGDKTFITQRWSDEIDMILCDSSGNNKKTDKELLELAEKVKDCFPAMRMKDRFGRDTPYYYRCNKSEVAKALKRFFTQFGNDYSDEDIIDATKRYVASFKGNYTGMRLSKYFIMKNPTKQDVDGNGYVDQVSDLLTFLENKEESESVEVVGVNTSDDWMMNVRN